MRLKPTSSILGALSIAAFTLALAPAAFAGPAGKELTKTECSECHLAYQGYFLPIRSWKAIMADLPNHFGEDASLDKASRREIEAYLVSTAADRNGKNPGWLRRISRNEVPLRISNLPWFIHEHDRRVQQKVKSDPAVGSIANCAACHRGAERGYFDDD